MSKRTIIVLGILLLTIFFGCTLPSDQKTITQLEVLKKTNGVQTAFTSDSSVMSSYISSVASLQNKSNTSLVRFELASAQAFYYLLKANEYYDAIDYQNDSCKILAVPNAVRYATLAKTSAEKAQQESNLSSEEKKYIREGQIESSAGYIELADQILAALLTKCGKI